MGATSSSLLPSDLATYLQSSRAAEKGVLAITSTARPIALLSEFAARGNLDAIRFSVGIVRQVMKERYRATVPARSLHKTLLKLVGSVDREKDLALALLTLRPQPKRQWTEISVLRNDATCPLLTAAEHGHWHVVEWMLAQGVSILTVDPCTGCTVLHAACKGGQADVLERLLQLDCPVETPQGRVALRDSRHRPLDGLHECRWVDYWACGHVTPLMVAAYYQQHACVRILIRHRASLAAVTSPSLLLPLPAGSSALHCAARGGSMRVAVAILAAVYREMGGLSPQAGHTLGRLRREGDPLFDLRVVTNRINILPYAYAAHIIGSRELARLLDPAVPLGEALWEVGGLEALDAGVPKLFALVLEAHRAQLNRALDSVERACTGAACEGSEEMVALMNGQATTHQPVALGAEQSDPGQAASVFKAGSGWECSQQRSMQRDSSSTLQLVQRMRSECGTANCAAEREHLNMNIGLAPSNLPVRCPTDAHVDEISATVRVPHRQLLSSHSATGARQDCARHIPEGMSPRTADAENSDDSSCPICMDTVANIRAMSCGHTLCLLCARTLTGTMVKALECPLCRRRVQSFSAA